MTKIYERSGIYSFCELDVVQQKTVRSNYFDSDEDAEETSYVVLDGEALPLSMFMRTNYGKNYDAKKSMWDGVYGTSAWGGYYIKISKCGSQAVVADRYF